MTARRHAIAALETPQSRPRYLLRISRVSAVGQALEVWQVPSPSTPNLKAPRRVAGLAGRNLELIEHRLLRRMKAAGIVPPALLAGACVDFELGEDEALLFGLLFRLLAPMRDRDNMRACADGVEAMPRAEAAYWLGMALHRKNPRRVLTALRYLLTEPK